MSEFLSVFGDSFTSILAFIVALSVIVSVHEFGHYIVARWCGIHAEVFSLGFGPSLFSRIAQNGTRWQVAAIPLGGYVRFRGDRAPSNPAASASEDADSFENAPLWARCATVIAGPFANFILSTLIFAALIAVWGIVREEAIVGKLYDLPGGVGEIRIGDQIRAIEGVDLSQIQELKAKDGASGKMLRYTVLRADKLIEVNGPPLWPARIAGVAPRSAAINARLKEGDVILSFDGQPITTFSDMARYVQQSQGRPIKAVIWRNGKQFEKTLTPIRRDIPKADGGFENRWMIGISGGFFFDPVARLPGVFESLKLGGLQTSAIIRDSLKGIASLVAGDIDRCNLQGVIGIAKTSGDVVSIGAAEFISFIAILSTAIGLMNLFPIPVLDGGHLMLYACEALTRRKPSARIVKGLFIFGFGLILALMIFALGNDMFCP